jgi:hypothetical protein
MMDERECGRKRPWYDLRYHPEFTWRDWGNSRRTSVNTSGLRAEIWFRDIPNAKQKCQPLDHDVPSFFSVLMLHNEPGSSVGIVSGCGLDDRAIEDRSPDRQKEFSSNLRVQICSGAHLASCTMGTGDSFPGGKARLGRDAGHSPHLESRSKMSRSYTSSNPKRLRGMYGTVLAF